MSLRATDTDGPEEAARQTLRRLVEWLQHSPAARGLGDQNPVLGLAALCKSVHLSDDGKAKRARLTGGRAVRLAIDEIGFNAAELRPGSRHERAKPLLEFRGSRGDRRARYSRLYNVRHGLELRLDGEVPGGNGGLQITAPKGPLEHQDRALGRGEIRRHRGSFSQCRQAPRLIGARRSAAVANERKGDERRNQQDQSRRIHVGR